MSLPAVDIIWNLTRLCPWDCSVCCVDAVQVTKSFRDQVTLRSRGLSQRETLLTSGADAYSVAAAHYPTLELNLAQKIQVLENLHGYKVKLDISGGDPLAVPENWSLLMAAADRIGKANITLTATGKGVRRRDIERLSKHVGEFNFTYDIASTLSPANRPAGYSGSNLSLARRLAGFGVVTRAELPLTTSNCDPKTLRQLYTDLTSAGITKLLLMRLFPVGRGIVHKRYIPSRTVYLQAINTLRDLERQVAGPGVRLQCALRHLEPSLSAAGNNPCDLLSNSLGLMADGTLLLSPWAIGPTGLPLTQDWIIGNLAQTPLAELLGQPRIAELRRRLDLNFGHCKVFAYLHSQATDGFDRLLDNSDPLYVKDEGSL
jgi:MoaA/NifB/PqqE/SkfB family radical SAM enzyme